MTKRTYAARPAPPRNRVRSRIVYREVGEFGTVTEFAFTVTPIKRRKSTRKTRR